MCQADHRILELVDERINGDEERAAMKMTGVTGLAPGPVGAGHFGRFWRRTKTAETVQAEKDPLPEDDIGQELFECPRYAEQERPYADSEMATWGVLYFGWTAASGLKKAPSLAMA